MKKLTVVLDMDETLLHVTQRDDNQVDVISRPDVYWFLHYIMKKYDVILYTAGTEEYATNVLRILDPAYHIKNRYFRQHTIRIKSGMHTKSLGLFDNDLSRIVLVDNSYVSFMFDPDNGIPIKSFYGDDVNDQELRRIATILSMLEDVEDVRVVLRSMFGIKQHLQISLSNPLDA